jgi:PhnB protein
MGHGFVGRTDDRRYIKGLSLKLGRVRVREAFNKLSEGGQVKFPFDLQVWGGYYGEVQDKFGLNWMIVIPA